jgi:hypothetical protein
MLGTQYESLTPAQEKIANTVLAQGLKLKATPEQMLSAIQTGLVESNLSNIVGGDADSTNWRQERALGYADDWAVTGGPQNTKAAAKRYFQEATALDEGRAQSAAELAADVQRPREDLRYKYGDPAYTGGAEGITRKFLRKAERLGLASGFKGKLPQAPRPLSTNELFHDPGINLADGQTTGAIGGHPTHVHYGSEDPRSLLKAAIIAQRHGGLLGENPAFGDRAVDSGAHTGGSHHYQEAPIPRQLQALARKAGAEGRTLGEALDITAPGNDPGILMDINKALARRSGASVVPGAPSSGMTFPGTTPSVGGVMAPPPREPRAPDGGAGGGGAGASLASRVENPLGALRGAPIVSPGDLLEQLAAAGLRPRPRRQRRQRPGMALPLYG